jgi:hypothetical protein
VKGFKGVQGSSPALLGFDGVAWKKAERQYGNSLGSTV